MKIFAFHCIDSPCLNTQTASKVNSPEAKQSVEVRPKIVVQMLVNIELYFDKRF